MANAYIYTWFKVSPKETPTKMKTIPCWSAWQLLEEGFVKINFDVTICHKSEFGGFGLVARDSQAFFNK